MQGIEPKFHSSLVDRMKYYSNLLSANHIQDIHSSDSIAQISELEELYEDYLMNKRKLEESIKNYRQYHNDLRRSLNTKLRELRREIKRKQYPAKGNMIFSSIE
jgi:uncharacterized protein YlxW (UPF0749 family)